MDFRPRTRLALMTLVGSWILVAATANSGQRLEQILQKKLLVNKPTVGSSSSQTPYRPQAVSPFAQVDANQDGNWAATFQPAGLDGGTLRALLMYQGSLIAAGDFNLLDHNVSEKIVRWDGTSWKPFTVGSGKGMNYSVSALAEYGGYLIAGGTFTTVDGNSYPYIAKWNGGSWSAIDATRALNGEVLALAVYNGKLYAGGAFTQIGGVAKAHIACWDSSSGWSAVGSGTDGSVKSLSVFSGKLFVGGSFSTAGGNAMSTMTGYGNIGTWNDTTWAKVGNGVYGEVLCFGQLGGDLYLGGSFDSLGSAVPPGSVARKIAK